MNHDMRPNTAVASLVIGEFLEHLPLLQEKFKPKRKNKKKKGLSRHTYKECMNKTLHCHGAM